MNETKALVPTDQQIQQLQTSIGKAGWGKNLQPEMQRMVAHISVSYGLDPLLDELLVMGGVKLYVTVAGLRRKAQEMSVLDGISWERVTYPDDSKGLVRWKCILRIKGAGFPFEEYGEANGPTETNPVAKKNPETMARTRALGRALRMATGVSLPIAEEADDYGAPFSREPRRGVTRIGQMQPPIETVSLEEEASRVELAEAVRSGATHYGLNGAWIKAKIKAHGGEIIVVDGKLDLDAQPTEILKAICDDSEAENKVA